MNFPERWSESVMSPWLKRIGIALVAIVVLLLALVAGALALIDTEAVKRVVSDRVEEQTGRELVIEGDLALSLFPWIGFELGPTRLANAPGFDARPFVSLERAELRVRLLPLFHREVAVDRVVLHGLSLNLARDASGRGNWADLVPEAGAAREPEPTTGPADAAAGSEIRFRVEGVELRDANLAWRDGASGQEVLVRDLDLETGPLAPDEPTPVRMSVTLEPSDGPTVAVALETEATLDPDGPAVDLDGLRIDLEANGTGLPGGPLSAAVSADVNADLGAGRIRVDPLALGVAGVIEARGALTVDTGADETALGGRLDVAPFSPRELLDALAVALPGGIDETALQQASAGMDLSAAGTSARIENLELRLDDTRATGSAIVLGGAIPAAELRLELDRIDLDRYLPAGQSGSDEPAAAGAAAGDPVESLPLESMRGVRVLAAVDVGLLSARGIEARNAALRVRLENGVLTLERLAADITDGSLQLRGHLDGRTSAPAAALQVGIAGIESAPLIRALAGTAPVSGRLDAEIGLDTAGATLDDWIGALAGRIDTTFSDGALEGINIAQRIRVALARFQGKKVEEAAQTRRTDFSRLHFAADVRDGVVESRELDLRAPLLRVGGEGRVDLRDRSVDYVARVLVTGTLEGQGGASGERLRGLEIPLRIRGPLTAPEFELAFADAMEARAKARQEALKQEAREAEREAERKLEQEVAEEKEKLERRKKKKEQEVRDKLEGEIKGLFD